MSQAGPQTLHIDHKLRLLADPSCPFALNHDCARHTRSSVTHSFPFNLLRVVDNIRILIASHAWIGATRPCSIFHRLVFGSVGLLGLVVGDDDGGGWVDRVVGRSWGGESAWNFCRGDFWIVVEGLEAGGGGM